MYSAILESYLHCNMAQLVSIGFDCGGWQGKKNAFSALIYDDSQISWKPPRIEEIPNNPGFISFEKLVEILNLPPNPDEIIIAIDAPLGIPNDFIPFFDGKIQMKKPASGIENRVAYRYTDQYINRVSGIKPLSILDKMGINMTVARTHVNEWSKDGFKIVSPKDPQEGKKIIEVYPGTIRKCSPFVKNQIGKILSKLHDLSILKNYDYYLPVPGAQKSDELDSALCAILGMSFLVKDNSEIPKLESIIPKEYLNNDNYIKEGWIYHLPFEELKRTS